MGAKGTIARGTIDRRWLPDGHVWDLHIEHDRAGDAGPFLGGHGNRVVPHITVSPWTSIDSMVSVLKSKRAEPHIVIGGRPGTQHPVVIQLIPFDRAGRSLEHAPGTPETNRAGEHTIQIEICARPGRTLAQTGARGFFAHDTDLGYEGFDLSGGAARTVGEHARAMSRATPEDAAANFPLCMTAETPEMVRRAFASGVAAWTSETYKALGNLFALIEHRVPYPIRYAHPCGTKRISGKGWEILEGIAGHCVAPAPNTHVDPTADFRGDDLVKYTKSAPNNL